MAICIVMGLLAVAGITMELLEIKRDNENG
jgi:hypothetical protein